MFDVAIIGAGIIGGMIAREFSKYELKICIIDKEYDISMGQTKANSAIVHAGFDAKSGSLKAKLNVRGSEMMEEICEDLSVSYINNGSLVVCYNNENIDALNNLLENGIKNGVKNLRIIDKAELKKLEPNISDDAICALYAETGAIVCPYELTEASIGNAMDNGAELKLNFEVALINKVDNVYELVDASGNVIKSKIVINAAGVYSDKIANMVEDSSFFVHPRVGEYMILDKECGKTVKSTIFTLPTKMGKGILVTPTVDGNLLLGPTSVDSKDKENKKTTQSGMCAIKQKAKEMVNNIDFRMVISSFCGLRATGSTGDFIINSPKLGFINVAGIESPGLSASPAIAEYVVELVKGSRFTLIPNKNYIRKRASYKNFKDWPIDKKNESIKKDPTFGNIVCRCEEITEGEIRHAIRTNPKPKDLDGVKRRTRAQMGRCQGGFCSPYIAKILAEELNSSLLDITKKGNNSYILTNKTKGADENA